MTEEDANEAISQHWNTGWIAAHGPLTADPVSCIIQGNLGESSAEWVYFRIDSGGSSFQTLDARQRERTGLLSVEIFTTLVGARRASKLIDDVRTILENPDGIALGDERIWLGPASVQNRDGAGWQRRLVTVPFRWYA